MKSVQLLFLVTALMVFAIGCDDKYVDIPSNCIGMIYTPTGPEKNISSPGQVNLGELNYGKGNSLVLIERSGIEAKESFAKVDDPKASADEAGDHRCMTKQEPVSLDVRSYFALPDYNTPQGMDDMVRIFLLGRPVPLAANPRVSQISALSIYNDQVRPVVREKVRELCIGYENYQEMSAAFAKTGEDSLTRKVNAIVANAVREKKIPLSLVNASPSNLMPDPLILAAHVSSVATKMQTEAIGKMEEFLRQDKSGIRLMIYNNQVLERIAATACTSGSNTIILPRGTSPEAALSLLKR